MSVVDKMKRNLLRIGDKNASGSMPEALLFTTFVNYMTRWCHLRVTQLLDLTQMHFNYILSQPS